jgi:hypothetical protein
MRFRHTISFFQYALILIICLLSPPVSNGKVLLKTASNAVTGEQSLFYNITEISDPEGDETPGAPKIAGGFK